MMDRAKLIEKIKSLLALATGVGNEHEKQLALSRAQELMARYAISISDNESKPEDIVRESFHTTFDIPLFLRNCIEFLVVTQPIAENFGVYLSINPAGNIWMTGFKTNVEIANYAINTLLYQGVQDFKRGYREHRTIGFATAFWHGFTAGMAEKFAKQSIPSEALVLYNRVKDKFLSQTRFMNATLMTTNAGGFKTGKNSAREAVLNPGIQSTSSGRLLG